MTTETEDLNRAAREAARDLATLLRKHWPRLRDASAETVRREGPRVAAAVRKELRRAAAELRKRSH